MNRFILEHDGLSLSYLDSGGSGPVLIALHAHMMTGSTFSGLAEALAPEWRLLAPDQRGHGRSGHAASYTRDDYIGDLEALFAHLRLDAAVVLGNSLGGPNAYQFAARHPGLVRALIIEDIGVEIADDTSFMLEWRGTYKTRAELAAKIVLRMLPYLENSIVQTSKGWQLVFNPHEMIASQKCLNGDHWKDWLATNCPALVLRGRESKVTTQKHVDEMVARRPNTSGSTLDGGHVLHFDNPIGFVSAVKEFLTQLPTIKPLST